jgi:hypothetical protein
MNDKSKVEKQREHMQSIERKLNAFADAGKIMEEKFIEELKTKNIEQFFSSQKLTNEEIRDMQIVMFSRMVRAEQRLEFLRGFLLEIKPDLWELKLAVEEKQHGGPKTKISKTTASKAFAEVGLKRKRLPTKTEFLEHLQFLMTGSSSPDEDGNYVVHHRTMDNYMREMKIILAELFAESLKAN